jgi:hypothetical protein
VTPSFSLPTNAGVIILFIVTHAATINQCSTTNGIQLGNNVQMNVPQGNWDYCLSYSSYPTAGISGFTCTWTQP